MVVVEHVPRPGVGVSSYPSSHEVCYASRMRNEGLDRTVARRITAALGQKGLSVNRLAVSAGIPQATLYRKLVAGRGSFTIEELGALGAVLDRDVASFLADDTDEAEEAA